MPKRNLPQQMYELRGPSTAQRITLAAALAACVAMSWWLLFAGGIGTLGARFGQAWNPGNPLRRACLAVAFTVYFVRVLFTEFVFLRRGVSWAEVFAIAPWVLCIFVLFALSGGTNTTSIGAAAITGAILFVLGSWMNSYSEYQRHMWKLKPDNRGKLYTHGLFRYTRHPNYFGDMLSFSGLCLLAGRWFTSIVPVLMLAGFVFVNIPALDAHLHDRYGSAFDEYAKKTRKLIPFVY